MKALRLLAALVPMLLAVPASAARIDTLVLSSRHLAVPDTVLVVTPNRVKPSGAPSVYLLNGYGGDHRSWLNLRKNLPDLADRYGMVLVTPHGQNSWYWDSPVEPGMQMESFITTDLVPYIDAHYPTDARPEMRAITGLSMGGHGALWLALRHPDIWVNAGSTSGGVDIRPFPEKWKMKQWLGPEATNREAWNNHTVINLVPGLKAGQNNIIFDCGSEDFFADVNRNLHRALLDAGIPHDYISRPGTHNARYWRNSILYQLVFFDQMFKKAAK